MAYIGRVADRDFRFFLITAMMLAIAAGHLFVISEFTTIYLGLPAWIWLQLLIVVLLLALAWIATELVAPSGGG